MRIATTSLYSKDKYQSTSKVPIGNNQLVFKQKIPIYRSFFSSNKIFYVFVDVEALNLRSGPGLKNSVIRILPRGKHLLSLSSKDSEWQRVYVL